METYSHNLLHLRKSQANDKLPLLKGKKLAHFELDNYKGTTKPSFFSLLHELKAP